MKIRTGLPAVGALLAGLVAGDASAFSYIMPDDASLLSQADGVVVATVQGEPVAGHPKGGLPHLRYRLVVERTLAGRGKHTLDLELPGTLPGAERILHIPGIPSLVDGERVLVFYDEDAKGVAVPAESTLGLFFETQVGKGVRAYDRRLEGGHDIGKGHNDHYALLRDASAFEAWIESRARGGKKIEDYLILDEAVSKFVIAPSGFQDGLPARWFQFAQGQSVPWSSTAGGMADAEVGFDSQLVVQQALLAWTSDLGSNINFPYSGTVASDPTNPTSQNAPNPNGVNTVVWNDPLGVVPGTYNCVGGTLAFGGTFSSSITQQFNGATYHPMTEGFVIIQDGVACVFNEGVGGPNAAETITHELGHALGFGHSAVDESVMRSFIHRDGRGASLHQDDRDAAAFLYPGLGLPINRIHYSGFEQ